MVDTPAWERRFTAPQIELPGLDRQRPRPSRLRIERGAARGRSGPSTWRTGARAPGLERAGRGRGSIGRAGRRVVWWQDDVGDETGRWMAAAFDGSEARPLVEGLPTGWRQGISFAANGRRSRSGSARRRTTVRTSSPPPDSPRLLRTSPAPIGVGRLEPAGTGGLSADGRLICLRHAEHGDIVHEALASGRRRGRDRRRAGRRGIEPRSRRVEPGARRPSVALHVGSADRSSDRRSGTSRTASGRIWTIDLPGAVIPRGVVARRLIDPRSSRVRRHGSARDGSILGRGRTTLVREATGEILGRRGPARRCRCGS